MQCIFLERYPRLFMKVTSEFPIHFLKIYSIIPSVNKKGDNYDDITMRELV
jgi:hypothetical protein